ncbi:hypothetical protein QAD02_019596 [Eretmocerus hayati]|uniref:Uncharacterized protein n=1 Tax=Eretmocerus hayati TaxID=131215 RepID=A0ACC2PKJ3_9HYME|nr:hypothetical protein QAD02_019596 [Eretmocerus hayati]
MEELHKQRTSKKSVRPKKDATKKPTLKNEKDSNSNKTSSKSKSLVTNKGSQSLQQKGILVAVNNRVKLEKQASCSEAPLEGITKSSIDQPQQFDWIRDEIRNVKADLIKKSDEYKNDMMQRLDRILEILPPQGTKINEIDQKHPERNVFAYAAPRGRDLSFHQQGTPNVDAAQEIFHSSRVARTHQPSVTITSDHVSDATYGKSENVIGRAITPPSLASTSVRNHYQNYSATDHQLIAPQSCRNNHPSPQASALSFSEESSKNTLPLRWDQSTSTIANVTNLAVLDRYQIKEFPREVTTIGRRSIGPATGFESPPWRYFPEDDFSHRAGVESESEERMRSSDPFTPAVFRRSIGNPERPTELEFFSPTDHGKRKDQTLGGLEKSLIFDRRALKKKSNDPKIDHISDSSLGNPQAHELRTQAPLRPLPVNLEWSTLHHNELTRAPAQDLSLERRNSSTSDEENQIPETRWTLRYLSGMDGEIRELVRNSRVFIRISDLENAKKKSTTVTSLARALCVAIFTTSALKKCSLYGKSSNGPRKGPLKPELDSNAVNTILSYAMKYSEAQKTWAIKSQAEVKQSLRGLLQEMREGVCKSK